MKSKNKRQLFFIDILNSNLNKITYFKVNNDVNYFVIT